MAISRQPVLKRCRNLGIEPAYLGISKRKSKKKLAVTNKKISEYGLQLKEKQKAKFIYGILEKQFRIYFRKADKMSGIVGENLLMLLELRLDNVIFRLGFARTRKEARQIVRHNHVVVNGKKVNIPSAQVSVGDVVEIKESLKHFQRYKDITDITHSRMVPTWLSSDYDNLKGTVNALPSRDQIDTPLFETLIVELYSR